MRNLPAIHLITMLMALTSSLRMTLHLQVSRRKLLSSLCAELLQRHMNLRYVQSHHRQQVLTIWLYPRIILMKPLSSSRKLSVRIWSESLPRRSNGSLWEQVLLQETQTLWRLQAEEHRQAVLLRAAQFQAA